LVRRTKPVEVWGDGKKKRTSQGSGKGLAGMLSPEVKKDGNSSFTK